MSSDSEGIIELPDDGVDDLFGDDPTGGDAASQQSDDERVLSDRDLASDQGEDYGGHGYEDGGSPQVRNKVVMSVDMYRHRIPKGKNGQVGRDSGLLDGARQGKKLTDESCTSFNHYESPSS